MQIFQNADGRVRFYIDPELQQTLVALVRNLILVSFWKQLQLPLL